MITCGLSSELITKGLGAIVSLEDLIVLYTVKFRSQIHNDLRYEPEENWGKYLGVIALESRVEIHG